jgi:lipopolysaccharide/colanic/teichoic acid biosynthesis glycosyltransferase
VGLILLALPFVVIALAIKVNSKGPVFFRQDRAGKDGQTFRIWKFRTMVDGASKIGLKNTVAYSDPRITSVGKALRNLSLDELPQLINVFQGTMSLIGPRPTLPYQIDSYNEYQWQRLLVKPGITSWASVNGRNSLPWVQRIELDVWYVQNRSFWLDVKVLFKTFWVAFVTREGLYGSDGVNDDFGAARLTEDSVPAERSR